LKQKKLKGGLGNGARFFVKQGVQRTHHNWGSKPICANFSLKGLGVKLKGPKEIWSGLKERFYIKVRGQLLRKFEMANKE